MTFRLTKFFLIVLAVSLSFGNPTQAFPGLSVGSGCPVEEMQGQWQHTAAIMVWEFMEGGLLLCSGDCSYKKCGKPIAWQVERNVKTAISLDIYHASEKVNTGCSMAARNRIMNLDVFGTSQRIENKP